ncbi:hypothetical protein C0Z18_04260 [Trinickia dabaoshanensis]|uniref:Uncharacterized protein n=2 Tax=Trinickia dabaoshanensis TaxID=564714 RepID=A0A2N7VZI5_9BURK|nr:hypothetical protein C0Z18_04260 [Trinickia dabaoshanensis]
MRIDEDRFQNWLMEMGGAIEALRESLPADVAIRLDFTGDSLSAIERFALARYPSIENIKRRREARLVDGMARYVGEVFRKHLGGRWIVHSDACNAFHGLPQLVDMTGQCSPLCPLTLVTASVDRRTGDFIRTVFDNAVRNALDSLRAN